MPNNKEPQGKEVGVRYVTVRDVLEMYDISERTLRRWTLGKETRKVLKTTTDIKGHLRMELAEVERVMANRNVPPNPLYQQVQTVQARIEQLEHQVSHLQQQVEDQRASSEQLLQALAAQQIPGENDAHTSSLLLQQITQALTDVRRLRTRAGSGGDEDILKKRGLPPGTIRLVDFVKLHQVKLWDLKQLHWARTITLEVYLREGQARRNKQEWWVTPEQHTALANYWHEHQLPFAACSVCEAAVEGTDVKEA